MNERAPQIRQTPSQEAPDIPVPTPTPVSPERAAQKSIEASQRLATLHERLPIRSAGHELPTAANDDERQGADGDDHDRSGGGGQTTGGGGGGRGGNGTHPPTADAHHGEGHHKGHHGGGFWGSIWAIGVMYFHDLIWKDLIVDSLKGGFGGPKGIFKSGGGHGHGGGGHGKEKGHDKGHGKDKGHH